MLAILAEKIFALQKIIFSLSFFHPREVISDFLRKSQKVRKDFWLFKKVRKPKNKVRKSESQKSQKIIKIAKKSDKKVRNNFTLNFMTYGALKKSEKKSEITSRWFNWFFIPKKVRNNFTLNFFDFLSIKKTEKKSEITSRWFNWFFIPKKSQKKSQK